MADEKQTKPETKPVPQATEKLVAKIAQAYSSLPAEDREKTLLYSSDAEVENPELDRTFDKLVETYSRRAADRGKGVVHIFPGSAAPSLGPLTEEGDEADSEALEVKAEPGSYECPECGHQNPAENRFCGRCGALKEAEALPGGSAAIAPQHEVEVTPKGVQHHHHYYHHHDQSVNKYLAALVVALCVFLGWQQWGRAKALLGIGSRTPAAVSQPAQPVVAVDKGLQLPPMTVAMPEASSSKPPEPKPVASSAPSKPAVAEGSFRPPVSPSETKPSAAASEPPAPSVQREAEPPPLSAIRDPLERLSIPTVPMPKPDMPSIQRVSQGLVLGELVRRVPPVYPPLAAKSNIEGNVVVSAKIAKDGAVTDVKAVSGHPMLRAAAVEAVKQWRYKPATLGGQPVEVDTTVTITFQRFVPRR